MLNNFTIAILICVVNFYSTNNATHLHKTNIAQLHDTLITDGDGNKYPVKKLADGELWMTSNLKMNIPGSYCYNDSANNCEQYGRLYTWKTAQLGCALLGEEWRLATNVEWQQLTKLYSGTTEDSNTIRKEAYKNLLDGGTSGFNALLGGGRDPEGEYARLNAHGFYWTATENDSNTAVYCNFAKGSQALYEQNDGEKERAFSVRCVKSLDSLNKNQTQYSRTKQFIN